MNKRLFITFKPSFYRVSIEFYPSYLWHQESLTCSFPFYRVILAFDTTYPQPQPERLILARDVSREARGGLRATLSNEEKVQAAERATEEEVQPGQGVLVVRGRPD